MSKEIERKFLVKDKTYRQKARQVRHITQGYLSLDPDRTVRVRLADGRGYITVKTRNHGAVRGEWEYEIPAEDAAEMLDACTGTVIDKHRYVVAAGGGLSWEVDEFHGIHDGLVVAEIELPAADTAVPEAGFIGEEVTDDARYFNSALASQA